MDRCTKYDMTPPEEVQAEGCDEWNYERAALA